MGETQSSTYVAAGVDTAEAGLSRLTRHLFTTWPEGAAPHQVQLPFGHFANVVEFAGMGLAITTDGVGSKILIAERMGKYDTIGIDCVAMNVNDLLCVGATPISMVDYVAVQQADPELLEAIAVGLAAGARASNISIPGGEIAQLRDMIVGDVEGGGIDLAGAAVGSVPLDKIIYGQHLQPGDVIIGLGSSGIHSNGLTLARKIFFKDHAYPLDWLVPASARKLGEELLEPTAIYVREIVELFERGVEVHGLAHITSDGLLNLARLDAAVGFEITDLLPIPPIFQAIQHVGGVSDEEMFYVYNMGVGFCVIVPASAVNAVLEVMTAYERPAQPIGRVVEDVERRVWVRPVGLVGQSKAFRRE